MTTLLPMAPMLLTGLQFVAMCGLLAVCLRHFRLARFMPLIAAGLLGLLARDVLYYAMDFGLETIGEYRTSWICRLLAPAAWGALLVGFTLVWRDLLDRADFVSEIHQARQQTGETAR